MLRRFSNVGAQQRLKQLNGRLTHLFGAVGVHIACHSSMLTQVFNTHSS